MSTEIYIILFLDVQHISEQRLKVATGQRLLCNSVRSVSLLFMIREARNFRNINLNGVSCSEQWGNGGYAVHYYFDFKLLLDIRSTTSMLYLCIRHVAVVPVVRIEYGPHLTCLRSSGVVFARLLTRTGWETSAPHSFTKSSQLLLIMLLSIVEERV
jgi:hypothetical protein